MNCIYLYIEPVNCVLMLYNGEIMWTNSAKVVPLSLFKFLISVTEFQNYVPFFCHFKTPFAVENVLGKSFYFIKSRWF